MNGLPKFNSKIVKKWSDGNVNFGIGENFGNLDINEVEPYIGKTSVILFSPVSRKIHSVNFSKLLFKVIQNNKTCACCGLVGDHFELRCMPDNLSKDKHMCINLYSTTATHSVLMTIDHIVPVSKGGRNNSSNLQLLCYYCNLSKSNNQLNMNDLRDHVAICYGDLPFNYFRKTPAQKINDNKIIILTGLQEQVCFENFKHVKKHFAKTILGSAKSNIVFTKKEKKLFDKLNQLSDNTRERLKKELEKFIRIFAYKKWEKAGRPIDDGVSFWLEAEKDIVGNF